MRTRSQISLIPLALTLIAILLIAAAGTIYTVVAASRVTGQQTLVMAPEALIPGSSTVIRAMVHDFHTSEPVARAAVVMRLEPRDGGKGITLSEGRTNQLGQVTATVAVPEDVDADQRLVIETKSSRGSSRLQRPVRVRRDHKLFLTTDKPLYQPGQTIHIRCLALNAGDLRPSSGEIEFTIEDPKGNKVLRAEAPASNWGIASLDFDLASEVNQGVYKITTRLGESISEKTVTVKPYVLPKFGIAARTNRDYYRPGERVEGTLQASYFFGKPVSGGRVEIRGVAYEIGREEVLHLEGRTDDEGRFPFSFELPSYFVGGAPEEARATIGLEITVIDQAEHAESTAHTLPIAEAPILIQAVPESGEIKRQVENQIYILTTYPDGSPAETALTVTFAEETMRVQTGEFGLSTVSVTPPSRGALLLQVEASDAQGNSAERSIELPGTQADEYILLRPERAAYRVGETMRVDLLASANQGTAYLDIIREGQTLSTRALEIRDGIATAEIDLDEAMFGTLQLHAYKVLRDANIAADMRLVLVDRASDISLDLSMDKETYRPGEVARLLFQASIDGQPIPAALGLSIVDESVFALQEQDAGFAKLYFLLQAEILKPRYQLKWFQPQDLLQPTSGTAPISEARDQAAKAVMAGAEGRALSPLADFGPDKLRAIAAEQQDIYGTGNRLLSWGLALLSAVGLVISLFSLVRREILWRTLAYGLLFLVGFTVLLGSLYAWIYATRAWRLIDDRIALLVAGSLLISLVGLIAFAVIAWRRKFGLLQAMYLLLAGTLLLLPLIGFTASRADPYGLEEGFLLPIAALGLILLGFYLRGIGLAVEGCKTAGVVGALGGGFGLLPILLIALALVFTGRGATMAADQLGGELRWEEGMIEAAIPQALEVRKIVEAEKMVLDEAPSENAPRQEAPRLRQFFPETMYWNPQVLTDEAGRAELEIPVADSITTWRLSALASSQQGQLGSLTAGLRVFQDFFIDLDLPLYLTQNDQVSLPVAVFNYLPTEQIVRLEVGEDSWFELLDDPAKTLDIASNDVEVVYFRIKVLEFGLNRFQVTAWGDKMSDAIVKEVQVMPDGKAYRSAQGDNLTDSVVQTVMIPEAAIPGTPHIWVKVYPGIVSQIVEGLSGLLRMPFG